jgi:hypothetical protein
MPGKQCPLPFTLPLSSFAAALAEGACPGARRGRGEKIRSKEFCHAADEDM